MCCTVSLYLSCLVYEEVYIYNHCLSAVEFMFACCLLLRESSFMVISIIFAALLMMKLILFLQEHNLKVSNIICDYYTLLKAKQTENTYK